MSLPLSILLLTTNPMLDGRVIANQPARQVAPVEQVDLEVDHASLLDHQMPVAAKSSASFVYEDVAKALRDQFGVEVVDDVAPKIVVKLAWKDYESSTYLIEVATQRPGEVVEIVEAFEATCINDTALTATVLARLPAALRQLETVAASTGNPVHEPPSTEPSGQGEEVTEQPEVPPSRKPLGGLGKVGTGLLVTGAVAVVVGSVVWAQRRRIDNPSGRLLRPEGRDFRPPGMAVVVTGGVLAATGIALLVVDRVRARRSEPDLARVWVAPTGPGMALTARF